MAVCNVVIDLSHHNQHVDLAKAAANGVQAVIHKATQGSGFADPFYHARRKAASDAGLLWGAYHFATGADPVAQARFFLKVADPAPGNLMVLDLEINPSNSLNSMTRDQARTFIGTIEDATGITPGLYAGAYLKEQIGESIDEKLQTCWLWWAQYGPVPLIPPNWTKWTLWQYTDGHNGNPPHTVDGIGSCDRDQYQGTVEDLRSRWATGRLAPPAVTTVAAELLHEPTDDPSRSFPARSSI